MKSKFKSKVFTSKTRYVFGVEVYSTTNVNKYVFDSQTNYNDSFIIREETVFSFFKFPIFKKIRKHDEISYFLFGFNIKSVRIATLYFKHYLEKINIEYDDAYILQGGSGEPFLWIAYASRASFSKNHSKKPLIVGRRESFAELIRMFLPDVTYIVDKNIRPLNAESSYMEYANHKLFYHPQKNEIYRALDSASQAYRYFIFDQDEYYVFKSLELCGIKKSELSFPQPIMPSETRKNLARKINGLNLNLNNFIILAPEADAMIKPPVKFWEMVVCKFRDLGLDVFLNYTNKNNFIYGCKAPTYPLTYSELYELAYKTRAIVSLRSGFSETILPTFAPNIVVLTSGKGPRNQLAIPGMLQKNPLIAIPFVKEDKVRGVYYYDNETIEAAAEAVLSCFSEIKKVIT